MLFYCDIYQKIISPILSLSLLKTYSQMSVSMHVTKKIYPSDTSIYNLFQNVR